MMANRFETLPVKQALSIFFTAGYPRLVDTMTILQALQKAEVDMVEVGFPFSDPVADGPTIQASNMKALGHGMNVDLKVGWPIRLKHWKSLKNDLELFVHS